MTDFALHPRLAADTLPVADLPLCRVVARFAADAAWPGPVWGSGPALPGGCGRGAGGVARGGAVREARPILVNAGRGGLQREADILRGLDDGTLLAATLDVFEREPLERESPLWRHPGVTVTPHNAALSDPAAVADLIAGQVLALERGEPLRHVVERGRSY